LLLAVPLAGATILYTTFLAIEDTAWTHSLPRGGLLVCMAVLATLLVRQPAAALVLGVHPADRRARIAALAVGVVALGLGAGLLVVAGTPFSRAQAALLAAGSAALILVCWAGPAGHAACRWLWRHAGGVAAVLCALLVLVRALLLWRYLPYPDLQDIGQTTLDAGAALLQGRNPYATSVDYNTPDPAFPGYKYPPAMIAAYLPLGLPWGSAGLRVTNLLLDFAVAGCAALLAQRHGGVLAGLIAAVLVLAMPFVATDTLRRGVTDNAAVLPGLAALLVLPRSAVLAGALAGLAVSTKLFPGVLFVLCCLPVGRTARFAAGVAVGVSPLLVAAAFDPMAIWRSIFLFNLHRPPNATSVFAALPALLGPALKLVALGVLGFVAWRAWHLPRDAVQRCAALVVAAVAVQVAGPVLHNNYMLWWLPALAAVAALPMAAALSGPLRDRPGVLPAALV